MSKDNRTFFSQKSEWAKVKDHLLAAYLEPYLAKILCTRKPLLYIDGFAGRGLFDDGSKGSPLIACEVIKAAREKTRSGNTRIDAYFIEKEHGRELKANLAQYDFATVVDGSYENATKRMDRVDKRKNIFMYVDPYGVKHLDYEQFLLISHEFSSAEVLLNFNSFGFFRAACRLLKIDYQDIDEGLEFEEQDPWVAQSSLSDAEKLTKIVGGDFWRDVVLQYKNGSIEGYEAEQKITNGFCRNLERCYSFVLNIPVRLKSSHRPKYRMIHLSNHYDGCLLMYDNMQKRMQDLFDIQTGSQLSLFDMNSENQVVDVRSHLLAFRTHVLGCAEYKEVEAVIAEYVTNIDLAVPLTHFNDELKQLEKDDVVEIKRDPQLTAGGRKSTFLKHSTGKRAYVRAKG